MDSYGFSKKYSCRNSARRFIFSVLAGLAFLLTGNSASAGVDCFNGNYADPLNIIIPSPISVARDYSGGFQAISGWVSSSTAATTCTSTPDGSLVRFGTAVAVSPNAGLQSIGTLDGFSVYKTSLDNIGVQINQSYVVGGCTGAFWANYPWGMYPGLPAQYPYLGWGCQQTATATGSYTAQYRARLVQFGPVVAGTVDQSILGTFTIVRTVTGTINGVENYNPLYVIPGFPVGSIVLGSVQIIAPTCTVSVEDVELKTVMWSDFSSATTLANTPFQFNLSNCPAGMTNFTYRIDPVTTAIDPANGVFANSTGTGMAQGVGLRLTDGTGSAAVRLDGTNYTVSNYSSAAGGAASIPMYVSYFRTGTAAQVTGGMVRGTAQLTLYYR